MEQHIICVEAANEDNVTVPAIPQRPWPIVPRLSGQANLTPANEMQPGVAEVAEVAEVAFRGEKYNSLMSLTSFIGKYVSRRIWFASFHELGGQLPV